ncbi:MAG: serine hydrolase [Erythrobacter sp.]|uniref:serine hydrolase domain-containing protein n=1 Tax=Erythrobacter sp. TaxID=1042 RepID=UPI0032984F8A
MEKFQPCQIVKGCATDPLPHFESDTPLPSNIFAEMKSYSQSQGGVALIVLVDGKVVGETYRDGADEDTRFFSFSMHKSVMALAYGAAIEDGFIHSIDDPIGDYIEEWANDPRGKIPLRAFLTMSSGLEALEQSEWRALKFNFSQNVSEVALSLEQWKEPFTQFHYKNTDSQLAGVALHRALKANGEKDYASYVLRRIWCPIGAKDALLWLENEEGDPRFYAFLDANLRDWARVGLMIMQDGEFGGRQILPSAWIVALKTPSANNPKYGLQTWIGSPYAAERSYGPNSELSVPQAEPYLASDVNFFDGFGGQRVYVVPSAGLIIARSGEISLTWDDGVLVNLALRGLEERIPSKTE